MRKFLSLALASILSCGIAFGADNNYTTIDYWDISKPKNTNGTFEFTATSINNAAVSKSTSIYIK